ncbi:MAG: DUF4368 domain-containing protein [Clostridia bacterium]|nr:DUF4368 domain-containing protein [Clostridia bacterium]
MRCIAAIPTNYPVVSFEATGFLYPKTEKENLSAEKKKLEQTRKRINEIDFLMKKLYEDMAFGIISKERYEKFAKNYEEEQKKLEKEFSVMQAQIEKSEAVISNIDSFLSLVEKYVDIPELTPKIINDFIKKIVVFEAEKIDVKRYQRV